MEPICCPLGPTPPIFYMVSSDMRHVGYQVVQISVESPFSAPFVIAFALKLLRSQVPAVTCFELGTRESVSCPSCAISQPSALSVHNTVERHRMALNGGPQPANSLHILARPLLPS